jgi:hypothetical protein
MSVQDFDELDIIGKPLSYEKYFGEMEITDKEKQERIKLAKKFESMFFSLFLMLLDENKDIENCYKIADEEYCKIATKFLNTKQTPAYINDYAAQITMSVIDTTIKNLNSDYYTSQDRAMNIAANEANSVGNYREQVEMVKQGYKFKVWRTMEDDRVRHTHTEVDNTKIGIFEHFNVGGSEMMFPKDTSLGASEEEIVNCRCSLEYLKN